MRKKLTYKERFKKYFTEKPKSDFWMWAFITSVFFHYVTPLALMILIPFQIGLLSPTTPVDYTTISNNVATALIKPMEIMGRTGSTIATNNPIIAKILFYALANFIYVFYLGVFALILNFLRYFISWVYRKIKKVKKK